MDPYDLWDDIAPEPDEQDQEPVASGSYDLWNDLEPAPAAADTAEPESGYAAGGAMIGAGLAVAPDAPVERLEGQSDDDYEGSIRRRQAKREEARLTQAPGLAASLGQGLLNAGSMGLSAIGYPLDALGRAMRTATNEGAWTPLVNATPFGMAMNAWEGNNPFDIGQRVEEFKQAGRALSSAGKAFVDPAQAATEDDLYRTTLKHYFGSDKTQLGTDGNGLDAGDVADTAARFFIGMGQDPLTFATAGATGLAKKGTAEAAKYIAAVARGDDIADAAKAFKAATGMEPTAEGIRALGVEVKLANRVEKGQSGLRLGIPGMDILAKGDTGITITGPLAAKPLKYLDKLSNTAREVISSSDNRVLNWLSGPNLEIRSPALSTFSASSGIAGVDALANFVQSRAFTKVAALGKQGADVLNEVRALGIDENDLRYLTQYVEMQLPKDHITQLAKETGRSVAELEAMRATKFKAQDVADTMVGLGYNADQIRGVALASNKLHKIYDDALALLQNNGIDIAPLGASVRADVGVARNAILDRLGELGIPSNRMFVSDVDGPRLRDLSELVKEARDPKAVELLAEYERRIDIAAKLPSYVPLRVSNAVKDKLLAVVRQDDKAARALRLENGYVPTLEEANARIRAVGTEALGGGKPTSKLSWAELGKAFMDGWRKSGGKGGLEAIKKAKLDKAEFFESHPGLALAEYLEFTAKSITHKEYAQGLRAMGDALPEAATRLHREREMLAHEIRAREEGAGMHQRGQTDLPGFGGSGREFANDTALGGIGGVGRRTGNVPGKPDLVEQSVLERGWEARKGAFRKVEPAYVAERGKRDFGGGAQGDLFGAPSGAPGSLPRDFTPERTLSDMKLRLQELDDQIAKELGPDGAFAGQDKILASKALDGGLPEGMDDFVLPRAMAEAIKRQQQLLRSPEVGRILSRSVLGWTSAWKSLLVANPGSMGRNKIGNILLRLQGNGYDALSAVDDLKILRMQAWDATGGKRGVNPAELAFDIGGGKTVTGEELLAQAANTGAIDNGMWGHEMLGGGLGISDLSQHRSLREGAATQIAKAPGRAAAWTARKSRELAGYIENGDKLGMLLARVRQGDSWESAALATNEYLFNYRRVDPATNMLRGLGVMPFAAWSRMNIPLQARMLVEKPGYYMAMMHAKNAIEQGVPGYDPDEVPDYVQKRLGITLRRDERGEYQYMTAEGVIPMADVHKLANPVDLFTEGLGPLVKIPAALADYDLFRGRKIKDADEKLRVLAESGLPYAGQAFSAWDKGSLAPMAGTVLPVNPFKYFDGPKTKERKLDELDQEIGRLMKKAGAAQDPQDAADYMEAAEEAQRRYNFIAGKRPVRVP